MSNRKNLRKKKLILPGLQFKLILAFLAPAGITVMVQSVLLVYALTTLASSAPNDMVELVARIPMLSSWIILLSFAISIALTVLVGIVITHRVAGPVYRLERYLTSVIAGERLPDCRLREGDHLKELCVLVNQATAPLRCQPETSNGAPQENVPAPLPSAHQGSKAAAPQASLELPAERT